MKFNPKTRRFIHANQELSPAEVRKHVDSYISNEQKEVDRESEKLLLGLITVAAFFAFMREKVQAWHTISGVVAYGGMDQMNADRWARINDKVQSELAYLANFEQETAKSFEAAQTIATEAVQAIAEKIPAGLETVVEERVTEALLTAAPSEAEAVVQQTIESALADSVDNAGEIAKGLTLAGIAIAAADLIGGQIENRAEMYTDAAYATFANNELARESDEGVTMGRRIVAGDEASCDECVEAATEEFIPLEEIPDIGSLQCMSNCRCEIEFDVSGAQFATSDLQVRWFGGDSVNGVNQIL